MATGDPLNHPRADDSTDGDPWSDLGALGNAFISSGYVPNSGAGGVLSQMFSAYLNGSMANPGSPWSLMPGLQVGTGNPGASLGTMSLPSSAWGG